MPLERSEAERLFINNLETVDRLLGKLCHRHGMHGDDAEEFGSWVKTRLIESDYAAFRQFRGEASISTYLAVVLAMELREYRVKNWGRWRPSAVARRAGSVVIELERLMHRDHVPFRQAAETLRSRGLTTATDRELQSLANALPQRQPLRPVYVSTDAVGSVPSENDSETAVAAEVMRETQQALLQALDDAIAAQAPEDRVILKLRFWENMGVADIARALNLEQKPLYRRIYTLLARLRQQLESAGISRSAVAEMIANVEEER